MNRSVSLLNCFLLPIIILLIGIVFSGFYAVRTLPKAFEDDVRGLVPPKFTTKIEEPGKYSLWAYSMADFEGVRYESGALPAGSKIHVIDRASGDFLPMNNWVPETKSIGEESGIRVGTFEIGIQGQEVDFIGSGLANKTVIGISSKSLVDKFNVYLAIFGIFIVSLVISITLLVVLLHRRKKAILVDGA